ncbi:hypothetical protein [Carboxylicivirga sp. N1Y90]|nr:(2Fe-2S)-binding protein [Marinilabiliaceae bacterium N1Y90]
MSSLICLCKGIRENQIKEAITISNAFSLELVQLYQLYSKMIDKSFC